MIGAGENTEFMGQEIFGPVLPLLAYRDLAEPLAAINARPNPLALYVYAKDHTRVTRVLQETSAGGSCVNASVVQFGHDNLPFGGIGNSGLGNSHGFYGFRVDDKFSIVPLLFPLYTPRVKQMTSGRSSFLRDGESWSAQHSA